MLFNFHKKTQIMSSTEILKNILPISLLIAVFLLGISYWKLFDYIGFLWASWLFFIANTLLVLRLASSAEGSRSGGVGANIMLGAMFVKFFTSIIFILCYYLLIRPESMVFVVPFFVFYAIYTVYETRLLLEINRRISQKNKVKQGK